MKALVAVMAGLVLLTPPAGPSVTAIDVTGGRLTGSITADGTVAVFKGIPYASPPTGSRRWRPPQAVIGWDGARSAVEAAASCPQNLARSRGPWTEEFMTQGAASEDCLYLNVWAPAQSRADRQPVYVWLHGGGFNEGSASIAVYDGEQMARHGVVVVGVNYRLGALGFLAHPDLTAESPAGGSGNYGLLDIIAALKWVQTNIAAFGGDPGRVTVGGQSAGAMAVHALVASPLARGLFRRAIAESGPVVAGGWPGLQAAESEGQAFASGRGASSAAELRSLSPEALRSASSTAAPFRPRPVIDGWLLPADPMDAFTAGRQNDVTTLTGLNADEGSAAPTYAAANKEALRVEGLAALHAWASARARTAKTTAYTYYFTRPIPWPAHPEYGAFHTSEVPYVFGNLAKLDRPWQPIDRRVSETLLGYWVNFITTGIPNGHGLPTWPSFTAGRRETMEIGERIGPRSVPEQTPRGGAAP
jgi:para-nitrobenzyl esterase